MTLGGIERRSPIRNTTTVGAGTNTTTEWTGSIVWPRATSTQSNLKTGLRQNTNRMY